MKTLSLFATRATRAIQTTCATPATLVLLAAAIGMPLLSGAAERERKPPRAHPPAWHPPAADGFDHSMQPVHHETAPHAPAHGWRYFSDPASLRAVVISPQGDYYYSRGKGLHWVAAEQM